MKQTFMLALLCFFIVVCPFFTGALAQKAPARNASEALLKEMDQDNYLEVCNIALITQLIQQGADANTQNKEGISPLHCAGANNAAALAKLLLKKKADKNIKDHKGTTPLHLASWNNAREVALILLKNKADVNAINKEKRTPLQFASQRNSLEVAKLLLKYGADIASKDVAAGGILHNAFHGSDTRMLQLLLENNADVNTRNVYGNPPISEAVAEQNLLAAQLLLTYNANPNLPNEEGNMALHWAAMVKASTQLLHLLVKNGAQLNATNNKGQTPLHLAAFYNAPEVVKALLKNGAQQLPDSFGATPLHYAILTTNLLEDAGWIMEKGKDFYNKNSDSWMVDDINFTERKPEVIALLLQAGAPVNKATIAGETPLHLAAEENNVEATKQLLLHKAKTGLINKAGKRPADYTTNKKIKDLLSF